MIDNQHPAINLLNDIIKDINSEKGVNLSLNLSDKDTDIGKVIKIVFKTKNNGTFLSFEKLFTEYQQLVDSEINYNKFLDDLFYVLLKEGTKSFYNKHILQLN